MHNFIQKVLDNPGRCYLLISHTPRRIINYDIISVLNDLHEVTNVRYMFHDREFHFPNGSVLRISDGKHMEAHKGVLYEAVAVASPDLINMAKVFEYVPHSEIFYL